jgi:hypothetical protein
VQGSDNSGGKEAKGMVSKFKNKIISKFSNIIGAAMRKEILELLPIILQLIEFQKSPKEDRSSCYDLTEYPLDNIDFFESLKERLITVGIPVESVKIDTCDFDAWLEDFPEIRKHYENMGDVFIEKCLEHYLSFRYLNISTGDTYIDVGSCGSPWAEILNVRRQRTEVRDPESEDRTGLKAYSLDLSFPKGINGINIGADGGDTKLRDGFASVLSLQCAYECFMGNADILFIKEANRILDEKGRYGIVPLYLGDIHFVSTSPYCDQAKVQIEPEAKRVWRDDKYKAPFSRHYSPESFYKRIYSCLPEEDMEGKMLYFNNLDELMRQYPGQRIYCFFMFLCEKRCKMVKG